MKKNLLAICLICLLAGCCTPTTSSDINNSDVDDTTMVVNILDCQVKYTELDSVLRIWLVDSTITSTEYSFIKQSICCILYDSTEYYINDPSFTYREILDISRSLKARKELLKQYTKSISFPFQLGESLTIPQLIAFGNRKDVIITRHYRDVYISDCAKAGNAKTYAYSEYIGNDLDALKASYNSNRKSYFWYTRDSSFIYKYYNSFSYEFSKFDIKYDTHITSYGEQIMQWALKYDNDIKKLYIEKYGEPLFVNTDTSFLCWDFKNIRLEIEHHKTPSWAQYQQVCFKHKSTYREWQQHSKLVKAREDCDKLRLNQAAQRKAYNDSVRRVRIQRRDL